MPEKKLNEEQLAAVRHDKGPLLIIAGAGTGKTTVVTERVKWLISRGRARPEEILALTFTDKAAGEMQTRVDEALPYGYTQMWIMTFHAFCDRVLRNEALHIGLDPKYRLIGEARSVQLFRKYLFDFELSYFRPLGNPMKFISGMLSHFSRLSDEDVVPGQYEEFAKKWEAEMRKKELSEEERLEVEKTRELARTYKKYAEVKVKEGVMDFADLISNTLRLFRERKNVLAEYQKRFKYVMVDEFQDTNFAQNTLAMMLSGKEGNIAVVGDDDQAVYRWRGAAVSNIMQFKDRYPKAKIVVLSRNYRSTQEILTSAYDLVQHNNPDRLEVKEGVNKRLVAVRKEKGEPIEVIFRERVEDEAEAVAKKIRRLAEGKGAVDFSDIAILVRANNHADSFVRALSRAGVPYQFLGPGRLFRQPEVMDLVAYLKLLYSFEDSVACYRVLAMEEVGVGARDLAALFNFAKKRSMSLFEACEQAGQVGMSEQGRQKVAGFTEMVKRHLKLVPKESAGQIVYYFLEDAGILEKLAKPGSVEAERWAENVARFFDKLKNFEEENEEAGVFAVVDWIELSQELGESPRAAEIDWTTRNAVNILTIHSAKGLEFPVVFLVNLVNQRFPSMERQEAIPIPDALVKEQLPEGDYHLEEERRLFYVGMTRAKERLFFTGAKFYADGRREKKLSPFVFEALGDRVIGVGREEVGEQLSLAGWQSFAAVEKVGEERLPLKVSYLSYSQMEAFDFCPLHYKLKYILRIPTPPSVAASFGTTIHETLKNFYQGIIKGEKMGEEELLGLLKHNWIGLGYENKIHERKMFEKGEGYLKQYLASGLHRPERPPVLLEEPFMFPLGDVKVGGRMDRVDDLGKGQIEIIDYKTGVRAPTQREVDRDLQMTFYGLAATEVRHPVLNKDPENVKLTFYYFDAGVAISTVRTRAELVGAKELILEKRKAIETSEFRCSGNTWCERGKCEFHLMCQADLLR